MIKPLPETMLALLRTLDESGLTNNQVADITGFSRPYVFQLRSGKIRRISRDKLIILFLLVLNYTFKETNEKLADFGYKNLAGPDSSTLISSIRQRSFSETQPIKSFLNLITMLLAMENIPGDNASIYKRPDAGLVSVESLYPASDIKSDEDALYQKVHRDLHTARKDAFDANLKAGHTIRIAICNHCLIDYIKNAHDRDIVHEHITAFAKYLKEYDNYECYILGICPKIWFKLKEKTGGKDTVLFHNISVHTDKPNAHKPWQDKQLYGKNIDADINRLLTGFVTGDASIVSQCKNEYNLLVKRFSINDKLGNVGDYLMSLLNDS